MTLTVHMPDAVPVVSEVSEDVRGQLERVLRTAIQRALDKVAVEATEGTGLDTESPRSGLGSWGRGEVAEPVDFSRFDAYAGVYEVPSYADEGELSAVNVLATWPKTRPG